jgi:multiple sugar transport system ATP-binding protein
MKNGVVQQIGAPLEIYHKPANQFVAGFIGSPAMNFIPCEVEKRGNDWFVVSEGLHLKMPLSKFHALAKTYQTGDAKIVLGLRPEDIHETSGEQEAVSARVEIVEQLGGEVIATCSVGANEIIARLSARTPARADEQIELVFDLEQAKLFDATNGKTLA